MISAKPDNPWLSMVPRRPGPSLWRPVTVLATALLLLAQTCLADAVVLKNGDAHVGKIMNATSVRHGAAGVRSVILQEEDTGEVLIFAAAEVDHVVFLDKTHQSVERIDFWTLPAGGGSVPAADYRTTGHAWRGDLVYVGLASAALGALVKFGGPRCKSRGGSSECDQSSYNALNYSLMVAGGVLVVLGVIGFGRDDGSQAARANDPCEPVVLGIGTLDERIRISIAYRISY